MAKLNLLKSAGSSDGTILVRDLADEKKRIQSVDDLAVFGTVPLLPGETPITAPGTTSGATGVFLPTVGSDPHNVTMEL